MLNVRVPFWLENNSVLVHAVVNGKPVDFILDTGDAIGPVFNTADALRLNLPLGPSFAVSGAGGATASYKTHATVKLGALVYPDETGAVDPNLQGNSLLGLPFFAEKTSYLGFDFETRVISFQVNDN